MCLQPYSRFPTCALLSLMLVLVVSTIVSGRQRETRQQSEFGLEVILPGETTPRIRLVGPQGGGSRMILRQSLKINDQQAAGEFTAVEVSAESDGDAIKVKLSIIYNDLSNQEWWKDKKERLIGTYVISPGESIRPSELTEFGLEPFEIKGFSALPVVLKPSKAPRIVNKTTALEVTRLEKHLDHYLITLKNISNKNIMAYSISMGNGSVSPQGRPGSPALAAGAIARETYLQRFDVERNGITISDVVFDDGSFEGDPKRATEFLAREEGIRIQSPHVLRMIEQTLKLDDSDLRDAFVKLEADLWVIPEAIDKPSALEFLKTKYVR